MTELIPSLVIYSHEREVWYRVDSFKRGDAFVTCDYGQIGQITVPLIDYMGRHAIVRVMP